MTNLKTSHKTEKGFTLPNFSKKNLGGFTLIELLVVIAIIGILAGIILISVQNVRKLARDAVRKAELRQIRVLLEMYYIANGHYPIHFTEPGFILYPCDYPTGNCSVCTGWCKNDKDPNGNSLNKLNEELTPHSQTQFPEGFPSEASGCWISYMYTTTVWDEDLGDWVHDGRTYRLATWLENSNDQAINNPTASCDGTILSECDKYMWGCATNYYVGPP